MTEKYVIFKRLDQLYMTPEYNYLTRIPNASLLTRLNDFETFEEVVKYMCQYTKATSDQFIDKTREEW